jgi:lauroyl/myristoyl acyltransferase
VGGAEAAGVRFVGRGASYEAFRQLLARGEVCLLMFDFKGATRTRFLGHKARLSSGTANLAWELDVPIVPVFALRRGHRRVGDMRPALEPRDFPGPAELHHALADLVSREIRANAHQAYPPEVIVTRWLRP